MDCCPTNERLEDSFDSDYSEDSAETEAEKDSVIRHSLVKILDAFLLFLGRSKSVFYSVLFFDASKLDFRRKCKRQTGDVSAQPKIKMNFSALRRRFNPFEKREKKCSKPKFTVYEKVSPPTLDKREKCIPQVVLRNTEEIAAIFPEPKGKLPTYRRQTSSTTPKMPESKEERRYVSNDMGSGDFIDKHAERKRPSNKTAPDGIGYCDRNLSNENKIPAAKETVFTSDKKTEAIAKKEKTPLFDKQNNSSVEKQKKVAAKHVMITPPPPYDIGSVAFRHAIIPEIIQAHEQGLEQSLHNLFAAGLKNAKNKRQPTDYIASVSPILEEQEKEEKESNKKKPKKKLIHVLAFEAGYIQNECDQINNAIDVFTQTTAQPDPDMTLYQLRRLSQKLQNELASLTKYTLRLRGYYMKREEIPCIIVYSDPVESEIANTLGNVLKCIRTFRTMSEQLELMIKKQVEADEAQRRSKQEEARRQASAPKQTNSVKSENGTKQPASPQDARHKKLIWDAKFKPQSVAQTIESVTDTSNVKNTQQPQKKLIWDAKFHPPSVAQNAESVKDTSNVKRTPQQQTATEIASHSVPKAEVRTTQQTSKTLEQTKTNTPGADMRKTSISNRTNEQTTNEPENKSTNKIRQTQTPPPADKTANVARTRSWKANRASELRCASPPVTGVGGGIMGGRRIITPIVKPSQREQTGHEVRNTGSSLVNEAVSEPVDDNPDDVDAGDRVRCGVPVESVEGGSSKQPLGKRSLTKRRGAMEERDYTNHVTNDGNVGTSGGGDGQHVYHTEGLPNSKGLSTSTPKKQPDVFEPKTTPSKEATIGKAKAQRLRRILLGEDETVHDVTSEFTVEDEEIVSSFHDGGASCLETVDVDEMVDEEIVIEEDIDQSGECECQACIDENDRIFQRTNIVKQPIHVNNSKSLNGTFNTTFESNATGNDSRNMSADMSRSFTSYIETNNTMDLSSYEVKAGHGERPNRKKLEAEIKPKKKKTRGTPNKHLEPPQSASKVKVNTDYSYHSDLDKSGEGVKRNWHKRISFTDETDNNENNNTSINKSKNEADSTRESGTKKKEPEHNQTDYKHWEQTIDQREINMVPDQVHHRDDSKLKDVEDMYTVSGGKNKKKKKRKDKNAKGVKSKNGNQGDEWFFDN